LVTVIKGHEDDVTAIAFNPKGKEIPANFYNILITNGKI